MAIKTSCILCPIMLGEMITADKDAVIKPLMELKHFC